MSRPPPSKPDRPVSGIRLSSQWVLLREGAALRLVPKSFGQTFGIIQINCARLIPPPASPCGHSRWFVFRYSVVHPSTFLRSFAPRPLRRFSATMDALTPGSQARGLLTPTRPRGTGEYSLVIANRSPIPSPTICGLTGDRPTASGAVPPRQASSASSRLARTHRPNQGPRRRPCPGRLCLPGLVVLVPLLPTPHGCDAVTVRYRTILHRTEADFHRSILLPSQAHWRRLSQPQSILNKVGRATPVRAVVAIVVRTFPSCPRSKR